MELFDVFFIASGTLGALGALSIIIVYFLLSSCRTHSRRLLLYLSIADLGQSLFFCGYLGKLIRDPTICTIHAAFGVFVAPSSFLWTTCLSFHVFMSVRNPGRQAGTKEWILYHLVSWGYPAANVAIMLSFPTYTFTEPNPTRGWFSCVNQEFLFVFFQFELPLVLCWTITAVMYIMARKNLVIPPLPRDTALTPLESAARELKTKFVLVPLIFVTLRMWSAIDLVVLTWPSFALFERPPWLVAMRSLCDPLQGFCNAVVFIGMNPLITSELRKLWKGTSAPMPMYNQPSYDTFAPRVGGYDLPVGSWESDVSGIPYSDHELDASITDAYWNPDDSASYPALTRNH
eukprot:NODE_2929_length_1312_cov_317.780488_g2780_i0.p1 GENE.NODE_2929_length_1312_cov_317.780488_g2780_i0~~NODE_2929_length_1312_cov_317.780488_g2780_i0.p1  ORF type:complete len:346 (+),score=33.73 NODE_2929_length_1312_cov_317.780488_g2780_i0:84-1121(+)